MADSEFDLYEILQVPPGAAIPEIEQAYRNIMKDLDSDDKEGKMMIAMLDFAYEILMTSDTRKVYDDEGIDGIRRWCSWCKRPGIQLFISMTSADRRQCRCANCNNLTIPCLQKCGAMAKGGRFFDDSDCIVCDGTLPDWPNRLRPSVSLGYQDAPDDATDTGTSVTETRVTANAAADNDDASSMRSREGQSSSMVGNLINKIFSGNDDVASEAYQILPGTRDALKSDAALDDGTTLFRKKKKDEDDDLAEFSITRKNPLLEGYDDDDDGDEELRHVKYADFGGEPPCTPHSSMRNQDAWLESVSEWSAAMMLQAAFRSHMTRKRLEMAGGDPLRLRHMRLAAQCVQRCWKSYYAKKRVEMLKTVRDQRLLRTLSDLDVALENKDLDRARDLYDQALIVDPRCESELLRRKPALDQLKAEAAARALREGPKRSAAYRPSPSPPLSSSPSQQPGASLSTVSSSPQPPASDALSSTSVKAARSPSVGSSVQSSGMDARFPPESTGQAGRGDASERERAVGSRKGSGSSTTSVPPTSTGVSWADAAAASAEKQSDRLSEGQGAAEASSVGAPEALEPDSSVLLSELDAAKSSRDLEAVEEILAEGLRCLDEPGMLQLVSQAKQCKSTILLENAIAKPTLAGLNAAISFGNTNLAPDSLLSEASRLVAPLEAEENLKIALQKNKETLLRSALSAAHDCVGQVDGSLLARAQAALDQLNQAHTSEADMLLESLRTALASRDLDDISSTLGQIQEREKADKGKLSKKTRHQEKDLIHAAEKMIFQLLCQGEKLDHDAIGMLRLRVLGATRLPAMDPNDLADPYCVVKVKPAKSSLGSKKIKTKTCKETRDPEWNEEFRLQVHEGAKELQLEVYDWDRVGMDELVGIVVLPFSTLNASTTPYTIPLAPRVPRSGERPDLGEIELEVGPFVKMDKSRAADVVRSMPSLHAERNGVPSANGVSGTAAGSSRKSVSSPSLTHDAHVVDSLEVQVMGATGLPPMNASMTCDAYCVVQLRPSKSSKTKQAHATAVKKKTTQPVWNETFTFSVYDFSSEVVIEVKDRGHIRSDETVGVVVVSVEEITAEPLDEWFPILDKHGVGQDDFGSLHVMLARRGLGAVGVEADARSQKEAMRERVVTPDRSSLTALVDSRDSSKGKGRTPERRHVSSASRSTSVRKMIPDGSPVVGSLAVLVVETRHLHIPGGTNIFCGLKLKPYVESMKQKFRTKSKLAAPDARWTEEFKFTIHEGQVQLLVELMETRSARPTALSSVVIEIAEIAEEGSVDRWFSAGAAGDLRLMLKYVSV